MAGYIDAIEKFFVLILMVMPRIAMATTLIPFLSKQSLAGSMVRNGIIVSFALVMLPGIQHIGHHGMNYFELVGIVYKELLIGVVIGFILAIPFWAVEGIGFFIDNQRGSTMASSLNPLTGTQTSPLGILLGQAAIVLFISTGGFQILLNFLYTSYVLWPIDEFYPQLDLDKAVYFIQQMDHLMMMIIVLASPAIITMFLSEFCFALANRFAQQLNVFVLSMPVKSAVALIIMVIYVKSMFYYLEREMASPELLFKYLTEVLEKGT